MVEGDEGESATRTDETVGEELLAKYYRVSSSIMHTTDIETTSFHLPLFFFRTMKTDLTRRVNEHRYSLL